ncbi:MAG: DbpA RNA binding domain-containing protein [Treponema sp.]|nr:DbpA RNA binding domain-containing protein [Treponema sp.]
MNSRIDTEKTQKIIALVMEKIKGEVDPWLHDYHFLFKKNVSLFDRSKVAAYLLMLVEQGKGIRSLEQDVAGHNARGQNAAGHSLPRQKVTGRNGAAKLERGGARKTKGANERHPISVVRNENSDPQRYPLADEDSKWLFFSVGRSRRISPREILSLINTKTSLPKEDIGAIRIFDNYSFVQVRDTVAETIIEALGGYVFRGRALVVNFAKSRKGEVSSATAAEDEAYGELSAPADTEPVILQGDLATGGSDNEVADMLDASDRQEEKRPQENDS